MQQAIGSGLVRTAFLALLARDARGARAASTKASRHRRRLRARRADARGRLSRRAAPHARRAAARAPATMRRPRRALRRAIDSRGEQQAKSFELRAATGLAQLLHDARPPRRSARACSRRSTTGSPKATRPADLVAARATLLEIGLVTTTGNALAPGRTSPRGGVRVPARERGPTAAPRSRRRSRGAPAPRPGGALRALPVGRRRPQRQLRTRRAAGAGARRRARQVRLPVDGVRRRLHRRMADRVALPRARARRARPVPSSSRHEVEPAPLTRLRRVIKFLDPRTGMLSADVWTLGGTMFRNLLVNWMVLIPLIAAAAMLPRHLPRTARPAVAAGARQPRDARLVVPPRLDPDRRPDRDRRPPTPRCSCRASAIAPTGSRSFLDLVPRAGASACSSCSRCTASGRGGSATSRRSAIELLMSAAAMVLPWIVGRSVQRPLVAAVDLDRRGQRPASSAACVASGGPTTF